MDTPHPTHAPVPATWSTKAINLFFGAVVTAIGVLNLALVHPVPGLIALLLSLVYWPWTDAFLRHRFGLAIPLALKVGLGLAIVWFTLGVSDLGDLID